METLVFLKPTCASLIHPLPSIPACLWRQGPVLAVPSAWGASPQPLCAWLSCCLAALSIARSQPPVTLSVIAVIATAVVTSIACGPLRG